ncbi:MAG: hypothetical protein A3J27_04580 [Candidatus Tectomicrobia bacterium RIFCSPLOWO2_12_FULL_69_37]|nr:MAG: hypothetical protein A3J27_04580 [Candidatus Tectomicrobia bacterium RIFCSPLOWO2_12_FULL_69_37]
MQYPFTEEQLALAQLTKDFMEREVRPAAAELDRKADPRDCYPAALIRKASALGLRTLAVPEEYGGSGASTMTKTLCLWTGGQIEIGTIKCLSQCWKVASVLFKMANEDQKNRWGKAFVEDPDFVGAILMTEPDHGSDNILRQTDPKTGIRMTAVRDGEYWVLNGAKRFNSLSSWARMLIVFARTDPGALVHKGTSVFLVPGDAKGVMHGQVHDKLGYRLYPNGETFFDNVRVHDRDRVGPVNEGFATQAAIFRGTAELPACNTSICRGLWSQCHQHAKDRVQGGKPIIEHPTVRHMLAEMLMNIEVAEQYMWRVCWGVDNDPSYTTRMTRYGKVFSDQVAMKAIYLATDILGGMGVMKESPSEKMIRDLITFLHGDGTDSLNMLRAAMTMDQPV